MDPKIPKNDGKNPNTDLTNEIAKGKLTIESDPPVSIKPSSKRGGRGPDKKPRARRVLPKTPSNVFNIADYKAVPEKKTLLIGAGIVTAIVVFFYLGKKTKKVPAKAPKTSNTGIVTASDYFQKR